jgi:thioredoxin reductase (NADPH)
VRRRRRKLAGQAASYLSRFASTVTVLVRGPSLTEAMSEYLARELDNNPRVHVRTCVELVDGEGDGHLEAVTIRDRRTGALERVETNALFAMIGAHPHTSWLDGVVARDEDGYVLTGGDVVDDVDAADAWPAERTPAHLETSLPGVFAAGDVRHGSVKRITTAIGEGAAAVQLVHAHLARTGTSPRAARERSATR